MHGGHVDDIVRSWQQRSTLLWLRPVLLVVLCVHSLTVDSVLIRQHRLAILGPVSGQLVRVLLEVLVLAHFAPDAANLELVAVSGDGVAVAAEDRDVVLAISSQHAHGQQHEEHEDAAASNRHGDGGRFEP